MPRIEVLDAAGWASGVADAWEARLRERPELRMTLATGSTPLPVYAEMAGRDVSWAAAQVLLLDEFVGLPIGDEDSCDAALRRTLIDHVDLPAGAYRAIDADGPEIHAEIRAVDAWLDAGDGLLDLAVLGVGTNGHLGMNEPGSDPGARTHRAELAPSTRESAVRYFGERVRPAYGVTVGMRDLLAAREVWVLATGPGKADVVAAATRGEVTVDLPASLLQRHENCTWWLDTEASAA